MSEYSLLSVYCLAVLLVSIFGGYIPFLGKVTHRKLQFFLSLSAGIMLGASFFHVMPEALEKAGPVMFGWWVSLGVVGLFCIERFIAPHSHEVDDHTHHHHHAGEGHHHHEQAGPEAGAQHKHEHDHGPGHTHAPGAHGDLKAAAPAVAGWMAVVGLTIHTFMNGFGLAGDVVSGFHPKGGAVSLPAGTVAALPGLAMFLAIVFHKPADALAISTVLARKGVSRRLITLVQLGFATMVPVGAVAFCLSLETAITESVRDQLTGFALGFSAGTFLFIALSDLLPEVQFHTHDRIPLFLVLTCAVAFMGLIALLEGQAERKDENHDAAAGAKVELHIRSPLIQRAG
ncbi:MAG TPA: ZIP family metal transporter [Gemmataceae bacterium]|nr:ZIP family metal transporter [Gemmataceae bacterium]